MQKIEYLYTLFTTNLGFAFSLKMVFIEPIETASDSKGWVDMITGQAGAIVLALVFLYISWLIIKYLVKKNDLAHEKQENLYKELLLMKQKEIEELKRELKK